MRFKQLIIAIILTIFKFILKVVYFFIKLFPTKRQIVLISRQSNNISLDFKLIIDEIKIRNSEIKVVAICKKIENSLLEKIKYFFHLFKIMYYLSTSKVCIIDSYCIPVSLLNHKKELKVIQIWHASGAIKKFGHQIIGLKEGSDPLIARLMCMHKNYNYVIAPSEATKKIFSKAFDIDINKIVKYGLPRLNYLISANHEIKNRLYKNYPLLKQKKIILYVPTFRKNNNINLTQIINARIKKEYQLIIRKHPLDNTKIDPKYLIDNSFTTFDLIKVADFIITDYSIISIEASILEKPIFLYLYDKEEYIEKRGLNINIEKELPSFCSTKFNDIIEKIENNNYNMEEIIKYKNKYLEINPKTVLKDFVDFILHLM